MNPLRLSATNYRTFERLDVDLPSGCVAVTGANGAGKSSLLNVVDVGLFAERGELAQLLTTGEDDMVLAVEFEHAGGLYRVRRTYSGRGRGKTTLDFERFAEDDEIRKRFDSWEPLTRENVDATQKLIEQTIGLSRSTFRASSFLAQGDGAAFTEAQPRDRKAMLAEILGLDVWDRLLEHVRAEQRDVETERVRLTDAAARTAFIAAGRPALEETLAGYQAVLQQAGDQLADAEATLERAQQQKSASQAAAERLRACQAELDAATADVRRAEAELADAAAAESRAAALEVELAAAAGAAAGIVQLEQQLEQHRARQVKVGERQLLQDDAHARGERRGRLVDESLRLRDQAADARTKAAALDAGIEHSASCDRCGQTLGVEAAQHAAASYRQEADDADRRAVELDDQCADELQTIAGLEEQAAAIEIPDVAGNPAELQTLLAAARTAAERRATLTEQVRQAAELGARRPTIETQLGGARTVAAAKQEAVNVAGQAVADPAVADLAVTRARMDVDAARDRQLQTGAAIARTETQLEQAVAAEQQQQEIADTLADLGRTLTRLAVCEKAYGRDGIPALIVEAAAIPQIEVEANRILADLGGATSGCVIELRTQRALKTSDQLRETLDIVIRTPAGDRPYETFSGGERTRLNLALRIALARLLANRRGAESRLLAIDEPDGLDAAGMDALARVLAGVAGTFEKILVVSHQPQLAAAFDTAIEIVNDGDRSRVASTVEAVAA